MTIALRIKELRKQNKVSQKEFASAIGIDDSQLSKIERGVLLPTINQIMEISSIYKITTDYLLLGKRSEETSQNNDFKELAEARLEIIAMKNEKIATLEKQLEESKYTPKEHFLYDNVVEPAPKLIKKTSK